MHREWTVLGREGFEELRIGEDREVVRARLGHYRTLPMTPGRDQYLDGVIVSVEYDDHGAARAIEVSSPCAPRLRGVALIGRSVAEVAADLRSENLTLVEDRDGAIIEGLGVELYVPVDLIEAVSVEAP